MSYYEAQYCVLKKSSKYPLYRSHFNNIPIEHVDVDCVKTSPDLMTFYLTADSLDSFNTAIEWLEECIGIEPYKVQWIEEKTK